jgi:hypothetical protein
MKGSLMARRPNRENERLRIEHRHYQILHAITALPSIANTAIKYGTFLGIAYCTYLTVDSLAGKTTLANIVFSLLTDMKVSEGVAYAFGAFFGGGGIAYGEVQRRLRRKVLRDQAHRAALREQVIDPNRSSSNLTPPGDTNPEDEL